MPWGSYNSDAVRGIRVPPPYWGSDQADAIMGLRFTADAEQAKSTGGMVALYPQVDDALRLQVPGGEPVADLHVTLCYLGEDVSDMDPGEISLGLSQITDRYGPVQARIMGHATFNPDGGKDGSQEPCAVYLVSDNQELPQLHGDVLELCHSAVQVPTQHAPWIPHMTAGYGLDANRLTFTGPITFDRVGLRFAGQSRDYPLMGS